MAQAELVERLVPTLADVDISALFAMLKGEPGTRKSTCALSFPTPQYWFSTDKKMQALTLPMKRWGVPAKDVHYDDYNDWDKPRAKLESMLVNCPYKTLIVDSVTSMGDSMTSQVKKQKAQSGDGGKKIGTIPVSGLEEFNAESSAFQELIALLKDIHGYHKVNVILIAHVVGQRKDNDANKLTHHSRIIITGAEKISGKLASYMTEAYHFNIKPGFEADSQGQYGLYTSHTGNDYARTSLPLAREIIFNDEPLYEKWIAPAIARLKAEQPIQRIGSPASTPPPSTSQSSTVSPFVK